MKEWYASRPDLFHKRPYDRPGCDNYGMTDGSIRMRVRAAVAGYMLLRWSVDASPSHSLTEEQYRLWLSDPLALYGVENAKLAPGYRAPATSTTRK